MDGVSASAGDLADEAGLRYVSDEEPGIRRVGRGKGFSYHDPDGSVLNGQHREWIQSLAIPPAWSDVWISPDPDTHILATGYDDAGRKQYIYHPRWEEARDRAKFDRMGLFGERLRTLRSQVDADLKQSGLPRRKVAALAVAVLDRTLIRVGNTAYADANESYGLTTLRTSHVEVNGSHVSLSFAGKGGADQHLAFSDRRLARLIARCDELEGQTLFSYDAGDRTGTICSTDVNAYLAEATGREFTAKDVRTWGASSIVAGELGRRGSAPDDAHGSFLDAVDVAAERLANTRDVCRNSYVHPAIEGAYASGDLAAIWHRARPGRWISRPESAMRLLLSDA